MFDVTAKDWIHAFPLMSNQNALHWSICFDLFEIGSSDYSSSGTSPLLKAGSRAEEVTRGPDRAELHKPEECQGQPFSRPPERGGRSSEGWPSVIMIKAQSISVETGDQKKIKKDFQVRDLTKILP